MFGKINHVSYKVYRYWCDINLFIGLMCWCELLTMFCVCYVYVNWPWYLFGPNGSIKYYYYFHVKLRYSLLFWHPMDVAKHYPGWYNKDHYCDVIMSTMASQINGASIGCSTACSKKTSKLRDASLCEGNPPITGGIPSQKASNAENVSIWWRHHDTEPLIL